MSYYYGKEDIGHITLDTETYSCQKLYQYFKFDNCGQIIQVTGIFPKFNQDEWVAGLWDLKAPMKGSRRDDPKIVKAYEEASAIQRVGLKINKQHMKAMINGTKYYYQFIQQKSGRYKIIPSINSDEEFN